METHIILLVLFFAALDCVNADAALRQRKVTSTTTETTVTTTTDPNYYFDGVDYELVNKDVRDERDDCDGQVIKCVRRTPFLHPVCAFNYASWAFESYHTICEVEKENCYYRVGWAKTGLYGNHYMNDLVLHNGEGYNCIYYWRRTNSPEEFFQLYFSGMKPEKNPKENWQERNRGPLYRSPRFGVHESRTPLSNDRMQIIEVGKYLKQLKSKFQAERAYIN